MFLLLTSFLILINNFLLIIFNSFAVARWGRRAGVKRFVLVSAIGAGRRFSRFHPSDGKQIATVMIEKAQLPIPNQPTVYRYHPQEFQAPRTR